MKEKYLSFLKIVSVFHFLRIFKIKDSEITQRFGTFKAVNILHFVHSLQIHEFLFRQVSEEEGKIQNRRRKLKIKMFVSFIFWKLSIF